HASTCTLVYFHRPRFSSGADHGSAINLQPLWQVMYEAGVDVVLSAHDHLYERFAPQDPDGKADPVRGIRQFTVGTGGRSLYDIGEVQPNSEVINNRTFGVLKLTLGGGRYHWEFLPVEPASFRDSGIGYCH
ncbi:MAG TPA: hypothetical protein VEB59_14210, partial [Gemmatimonadales bacterium]|nr:hypothetical protein [Gemmatimonadales bacterium]